jgi:hypothetical protein
MIELARECLRSITETPHVDVVSRSMNLEGLNYTAAREEKPRTPVES